jgi:DNA transposition AAA+ family ATPase
MKGSAMSAEQIQEEGVVENPIAMRLRDYLEATKLSQSAVAKGIGVAGSAISSYLKGRYPGDVPALEKRLEKYLDLQEERLETGVSDSRQVVRTAAYTQIQGFLHQVQRRGRFGIAFGNAGTGKTTALRAYADDNPGLSLLIEADHGYTARTLFAELCDRLNLEQRGGLHDLLTRVVDKLSGSQRLIIVDEAEHLPYRALELIRRVRDKAGVGVVLAGMPRLLRNLRGDAHHFAQLYSRINARLSIPALSEDDIGALVKARIGRARLDESFLPAAAKACKHNARVLDNLLGWCEDLAAQGAGFDAKMIDTARAYSSVD